MDPDRPRATGEAAAKQNATEQSTPIENEAESLHNENPDQNRKRTFTTGS